METNPQGQARITVTKRALFQRVNRKLQQTGAQLRAARTEQAEAEMGRYFIVNARDGVIAAHHVNLEDLGRELGLLRPWEQVTE